MYVCLCNAFTDGQVREEIRAGAGTVAQIYRGLNCQPRCGRCVPMLREMLGEPERRPLGG